MRIGGIVLCGGRSSRMGRAKSWLPFGGEFLLTRVVRLLREAVEPVVVVAAPGQELPPLPLDVAVVHDEKEGQGPLAGLAAGLAALGDRCDAVYLSACDAPFLAPAFVRLVVGTLEEPLPPTPSPKKGGGADSPLADARGSSGSAAPESPPPFLGEGVGGRGSNPLAAVPQVEGRLHPLAAAYRVEVLPVVRAMLASGERRMTALFDHIPAHLIEVDELRTADPELRSLRNLNTPEEYAAALRELGAS